MAKGRKNTMTLKAIKASGAEINPNGIYYAATGDRAYVMDLSGKPVYISASKAGGHKEMFYAAAGIRNYITKHGKRPNKAARNQILNRAINAEKTKAIWKKRYEDKAAAAKERKKNPFRKESPELKARQEGITIEMPKLSEIKERTETQEPVQGSRRGPEKFETTLRKAVDKGIITTRSAAIKKKNGKHSAEEEMKKLGMNMDPRYLTFYNTKNGPKVLVRITTKEGHQKVELVGSDFKDEKELFSAADKVRRHILRTGKVPGFARREKTKTVNDRPVPSEVNPPQKKEDGTWADVMPTEQQVKSTKNTSIFTKIKMWIFG